MCSTFWNNKQCQASWSLAHSLPASSTSRISLHIAGISSLSNPATSAGHYQRRFNFSEMTAVCQDLPRLSHKSLMKKSWKWMKSIQKLACVLPAASSSQGILPSQWVGATGIIKRSCLVRRTLKIFFRNHGQGNCIIARLLFSLVCVRLSIFEIFTVCFILWWDLR